MSQNNKVETSPDGRVRISYASEEMRMSLWVDVPHVADTATGTTLFKPHSSLVSGEHEWGEDGKFSLYLRRYPDGAFGVRLRFDVIAGTVRIDEDQTDHPIAFASRLAEDAFARNRHSNEARTGAHTGQAGVSTPLNPYGEPLSKRLKRTALIFVLAAMLLGLVLGVGYLFAD